jgi:hypothetical protein
MSRYPLTSFIETNKAVLDAANTLLDTITGLNCYMYGGTSLDGLFKLMPQVKTPAAVMAYDRSSYYDDKQRRVMRFHVLIIVTAAKDPWVQGVESWSGYVTSAIGKLDGVLLVNDAYCEAESDEAMDFGPTLAACDIVFKVMDH